MTSLPLVCECLHDGGSDLSYHRLALVCAALKAMRAVVVRALDHRKKNKLGMKEELTIDHIIAAHRNDKEAQVGDCLTYILSGIPRISSCEYVWVYRIVFSRLSTMYTSVRHCVCARACVRVCVWLVLL